MRLNHVTLIVSDFERSKDFYLDLGLIQIVDSPPRYARFQLPDGDATLSIEVTDEPQAPPRAQLFFECDDIDATFAALRARGNEFWQDPTDMNYLWREARFHDPDGHDLRLYNAGANRLNPPWRIKPSRADATRLFPGRVTPIRLT
jgi:catechol 2,3-dioxygenase-like lactoylglutathione lyase family enzyme